jgi:hypothetical protein
LALIAKAMSSRTGGLENPHGIAWKPNLGNADQRWNEEITERLIVKALFPLVPLDN